MKTNINVKASSFKDWKKENKNRYSKKEYKKYTELYKNSKSMQEEDLMSYKDWKKDTQIEDEISWFNILA